jgi:hypothetical protein
MSDYMGGLTEEGREKETLWRGEEDKSTLCVCVCVCVCMKKR